MPFKSVSLNIRSKVVAIKMDTINKSYSYFLILSSFYNEWQRMANSHAMPYSSIIHARFDPKYSKNCILSIIDCSIKSLLAIR